MKYDNLLELLPDALERDRILEQSRVVRKELNDSTIPVFRNAKGLFEVGEVKSNEALTLQKTYEKLAHRHESVIDDVADALVRVNDNLDAVEAFVQKNFDKNIIKANISIKELNVIQFVGVTQFVSSYARKLLAYFYSAESSNYDDSTLKFNESVTKADSKYITDNFLDFVNALGSLSVKETDLDRLLSNLPEVSVNRENIRSILAIQTDRKVDPLNLRYLNVTNNFFYRLQLYFTEWSADRYKVALEEKKMLEYRNLLLKKQREGGADAYLEKEIAVNEDRIARLTYKIRKAEEEVA